ncbi:MAG: hypothetical protein E6H74_02990 [Betaproteobacteria bacterium]|nr:MAG: hypothetical protein E6H74_02990 [Betaproteobacteria bacterium]
MPAALAAFQDSPGDAPAREKLAADLEMLKDDAELIGDPHLQDAAATALQELARAGAGDTAALREAVAEIASDQDSAPAPAPSEETLRLLETDASQLDAELLDIYLTEAGEVLDSIEMSAAQLRSRADDHGALATVRRGFHTLKGSGRMVGLNELGELAFEVEKVHNRVLEEDRPTTPALLALIDIAQQSFRGWVDALRHTHRVTPDPRELRAAIARVEGEFPAASAPVAAAVSVEVPGESHAVQPSQAIIEVIELDDTPPPVEPYDDSFERRGRSVASAEIIEFAPLAAEARRAKEPAANVLSEPDEISVGDVTLSMALYRILCDEAQQHLATLDAELQALQFDSTATPSQAMVRAGHTLCGIHRTGGFPLVASVAKAMEICLLGLQERGPPLPSISQPVLVRAIAGLRALTGRVRAREPFGRADEAEAGEIVAELDALRQEASPEPEPADIETVAERVADSDEIVPLAVVPPAPERDAEAVPPRSQDVAVVAAAPVAELHPEALQAKADTAAASPPVPVTETLASIHDDVDRQVLPIFLEEAAELFPHAGVQLRAWRRKPADSEPVQGLRRTLHTFKGSARMAGAMRLGELAHLMESRLPEGTGPFLPHADLFDALDNDLDHIAFVLDRLHHGEVDTPLPWIAEELATQSAEHAGVPMPPAPTPPPPTPAAHAVVIPLPVAAQPAAPEPAEHAQPASSHRGRAEVAQGQPAGTDQQCDSPALASPRNRNSGRVADPVADDQRERGGVRSAGVRSLYEVSGAHARSGRGSQRRIDSPAGVAEESRRSRRSPACTGAPVARRSAAAVLDTHRTFRQPVRAPLPDYAPDRQGARQARKPGDSRNSGRTRSLGT